MHNINTMSNVKITPVRKIKENEPLIPYATLTFILLLGLPKYSIQVLNLLIYLLTSQRYQRNIILLTSIKSFFSVVYKDDWVLESGDAYCRQFFSHV